MNSLRIARVALSLVLFAIGVGPRAVASDRAACSATEYSRNYSPFAEVESEAGLLATSIKLSGYKTKGELDRYFRCWGESEELFRIYQSEYRQMIEDAAFASGVPFSVLACLFFYESKFHKKAESPVHAKGLAQIMPGTWKDIKKDLIPENAHVSNPFVPANLKTAAKNESEPEVKDAVYRITALYERHWDEKKRELRGKNPLIELRMQLDRLAKYPEFAGRAHVRVYLQNVMTALNRIYTQEIYSDYLAARARDGKSPPSADLFNAEYSIIMGTIRLRRVYKDLFDLKVADATHDQWVAAAGAYNIGPGAIRCKANTSADECIRITATEETRGHMRGVKNCSETGNMKNKKDETRKGGCGA
jgi:hypothetical protein